MDPVRGPYLDFGSVLLNERVSRGEEWSHQNPV